MALLLEKSIAEVGGRAAFVEYKEPSTTYFGTSFVTLSNEKQAKSCSSTALLAGRGRHGEPVATVSFQIELCVGPSYCSCSTPKSIV